MMSRPDWDQPDGDYECPECGAVWSSISARDMCALSDSDESRELAARGRSRGFPMANEAANTHTRSMEITPQSTTQGIYISAGSPQTSSTPVKGGFSGQTIRVDSVRVSSARS